jgi:DHA2 family multidrug resistance protein
MSALRLSAPQNPVPQAPAPSLAPVAAGDAVPLKTWIAVIGATIGAFMAVLNIQIVNASLKDIQGAIGAGLDDGGWISTAYLVAEIITIPLAGWLTRTFSLRNYLLVNAALFLLFSAACAFATSLPEMIVLRAIQGFTGGVLIPLALTIVMTQLPKAKQPAGLAMFAVSATFAPAIGPTIGGYLTDTYGWQYIFFLNLLPGAVMLAMLSWSLPRVPMRLSLLREGDWAGIATMAIGLGALETVLEEGNKKDWFGSPFILELSILAVLSLVAFLAIELVASKPLLNLRLLLRRNFGLGTLALFLMGFVLYGSVYLLPVYLAQMQGYNAQQIGTVMAWAGLPQLALIPIVQLLMKRIDSRYLAAAGLLIFAVSAFMSIGLSQDFGGPQFITANLVRALGQGFMFAPLVGLATAGIEPEQAASASALTNVSRNLGGAVGIALLQTFLTKREQFHSAVITPALTMFGEATRGRLDEITRYFMAHGLADPAQARRQAVATLGHAVRQQSFFLAYGDAFFLLGVALVLAAVSVLVMRKAAGQGATAAH